MVLLSFLLTFAVQSFALSDSCVMNTVNNDSPCHSEMDSSVTSNSMTTMVDMHCCDNDPSGTSSSKCSCPDSGCFTTLTLSFSLASGFEIINEQSNDYKTVYFLNRIENSLFRPPIV